MREHFHVGVVQVSHLKSYERVGTMEVSALAFDRAEAPDREGPRCVHADPSAAPCLKCARACVRHPQAA